MKITEKYKRSSDSLVVDFLIKIARRYFFFFAYMKVINSVLHWDTVPRLIFYSMRIGAFKAY